jgi:cation diffusion facilitator family transporter
MHQTTGTRDAGASFPLAAVDEQGDRREANRAIGVSAVGLALTGFAELALALLSGSVGLLGDALHNLSDVSTSLAVFIGFRASRRASSDRYPYGLERAEDIAGIGIALVIWASAAFAAAESVHKLIHHGATHYAGWGAGGAVLGILGNQIVARYKLRIGTRINSHTLIADAKHSWLDALSSAGALAGLLGVLAGARWADPVAGLVVTAFICHVGWEVTSDVVHRLLDGVDPHIVTTAERVAAETPGVQHAHARARWTGRTLRVEVEGWVDAQTTVIAADSIGRAVSESIARELPDMRSFTWTARGV